TFARLIGGAQVEWKCRAHFFVVASQQMRRILIDSARRRQNRSLADRLWVEEKDRAENSLPHDFQNHKIDLLALDTALEELAQISPRATQIVVLRYFGGLTEEETAEVAEVSLATVKRDWNSAKAWLFGKLNSDPAQ
ncbi:MAG: sigma-70 family RNA polymerase sigma factor, partial [Blastocatellia bacterium]